MWEIAMEITGAEYINEMHLFVVSCKFRKINSEKRQDLGLCYFESNMMENATKRFVI